MVTSVGTTSYSASTNSGAANGGLSSVADMQDRFLTLLVAQINNQDPLSPMDNAQMTSQMAQINTVSGIQQVNQTLEGIASQFVSMQALQATALIGQDVLMSGNALVRDPATGMASAAFDLAGDAQQVKVDILSPTGTVLGTIDAGAMGAGRHSFTWDASAYPNSTDLSYRVTATNGNQNIVATTYTTDRVLAVGASNGLVMLDLQSGRSTPYANVVAIL